MRGPVPALTGECGRFHPSRRGVRGSRPLLRGLSLEGGSRPSPHRFCSGLPSRPSPGAGFGGPSPQRGRFGGRSRPSPRGVGRSGVPSLPCRGFWGRAVPAGPAPPLGGPAPAPPRRAPLTPLVLPSLPPQGRGPRAPAIPAPAPCKYCKIFSVSFINALRALRPLRSGFCCKSCVKKKKWDRITCKKSIRGVIFRV